MASGLHEDFSREEHVKAGSDKGFGQVFAGFFAVLAALSWWRGHLAWHYTLPIAAIFLVIAYTYPKLLAPLNKAWLKLGLLMFKVVNPIVMGLLFFVTITPIGIVMRMTGKDFLRMRMDKDAKTYWIDRAPPGPPPQSMKNQF